MDLEAYLNLKRHYGKELYPARPWPRITIIRLISVGAEV